MSVKEKGAKKVRKLYGKFFKNVSKNAKAQAEQITMENTVDKLINGAKKIDCD